MDVFYAYTYGTGTWLSLQGLVLVTTPKLVTRMLLDDVRPPSDLEIYFARCFGIGLLTIAALTVLLTGSIPLITMAADSISTEEADPKAPYASPTLLVTSLFHAANAFYDHSWYTINGQTGLALGMVGSAVIAFVGLWCLLFASSHGRISRKNGTDKRTAGYPFKNTEADKRFPEKKKKGL